MHNLFVFLVVFDDSKNSFNNKPVETNISQYFSVFLLLDPFCTWTILLIAPPPDFSAEYVKDLNFASSCPFFTAYCSDFRYETNGIFMLGVGFFFFRQISTL